jgi:hypothetical protein
MTFNVGLFCAVILGYMLGAFFFASFPENFAMYLQVRCNSIDIPVCTTLEGQLADLVCASAVQALTRKPSVLMCPSKMSAKQKQQQQGARANMAGCHQLLGVGVLGLFSSHMQKDL